MRLASTASERFRVRNSLAVSRERLEPHRGHSSAGYLLLVSLLASWASCFVDRVALLVRDELTAHRAGPTDLVASASDSLELDSPSIVELLCAADKKGQCLQLSQRH